MTTSAQHRVECGIVSRQRKSVGRPAWDETIDVSTWFHDEDLSFEEKRDAIVTRLQASRWFRRSEEYATIREIVEELSEVRDEDEFDCAWDAVYDEADLSDWRVWITT